MSIVIPIIHETIDTVIYIMHKVKPLESFYSIKNKYGNEKDLLDFNPHQSKDSDQVNILKYLSLKKLTLLKN